MVLRRSSVKRQALLHLHPRIARPYFQQFFGAMPAEAGLIGVVSLFKSRRIKELRRTQSLFLYMPCHFMSEFEKKVPLTGDRRFESASIRQRV
jgi:hypothetical protein